MAASKLPIDYDACLAIWARLGWHELPQEDEDSVWERFERSFGFFGCGIREPVPSAVWDTNWVYDCDPDVFGELVADMNGKLLRALRACTAPGGRVYALDWQHPCFSFDLRGGVSSGDPDEWAVGAFPARDHHVFLAPDFRYGLIGDLAGSVCVFGEPLLAALGTDPPAAFVRLARRDGQPVNLQAEAEPLLWPTDLNQNENP